MIRKLGTFAMFAFVALVVAFRVLLTTTVFVGVMLMIANATDYDTLVTGLFGLVVAGTWAWWYWTEWWERRMTLRAG
jgi:hypothetical protein